MSPSLRFESSYPRLLLGPLREVSFNTSIKDGQGGQKERWGRVGGRGVTDIVAEGTEDGRLT